MDNYQGGYRDDYDDDYYDDYSSGSSGLKIFFGITLIIFAIIAIILISNYQFCFIPFMQGTLCKDCPPGLGGSDCSINMCDRGKMVEDTCVCDPEFTGKTCRMQKRIGKCEEPDTIESAGFCVSTKGGCPCPNAFCTPFNNQTNDAFYIRSSPDKSFIKYNDVLENYPETICIGTDAEGNYLKSSGPDHIKQTYLYAGKTMSECQNFLKQLGCTK